MLCRHVVDFNLLVMEKSLLRKSRHHVYKHIPLHPNERQDYTPPCVSELANCAFLVKLWLGLTVDGAYCLYTSVILPQVFVRLGLHSTAMTTQDCSCCGCCIPPVYVPPSPRWSHCETDWDCSTLYCALYKFAYLLTVICCKSAAKKKKQGLSARSQFSAMKWLLSLCWALPVCPSVCTVPVHENEKL